MSDIVKKDSAIVGGAARAFEQEANPPAETRDRSVYSSSFADEVIEGVRAALIEWSPTRCAEALIPVLQMDARLCFVVNALGPSAITASTRTVILMLTQILTNKQKMFGEDLREAFGASGGGSWTWAIDEACADIARAEQILVNRGDVR